MNCKVCGNTSARNSSVSFFRFPKENSKCRDWADRCDMLGLLEKHGNLRFYKSFRICSEHFDPKDVVFDGRKKRLVQSAIPQKSKTNINATIQEDTKNINFKLPENLCRLCAEKKESFTDVFSWKGKLLNLETKLKYLPQVIKKCDLLPSIICIDCLSKVDQFYDFITKCNKAEAKLRAMIKVKDCNNLSQLTKSNVICDEKVALESNTNLKEIQKFQDLNDSTTFWSKSLNEDYYDQVPEKNFINKNNLGYFSNVREPNFVETTHLYSRTNFKKEIDFSKSISFKHDYSKMVSQNQLQSVSTTAALADGNWKIQADHNFTGETKFICDICSGSFLDFETLSAHSLTHSLKWNLSEESLKNICAKAFRSRCEFNEHAYLKDNGHDAGQVRLKKFREIAFLDNPSLANQSKISRSSFKDLSRPFQISRESKTKARLKLTVKCDKTKSSLIRELNLSHSKLKRRGCGIWERLLKNKAAIDRKKIQTGKSHRCKECTKFFRSKASLRQHRAVHSEKRLYNCHECGMSFKRKDTLCNHLRIHTGERPFVCKVCGFAFKQRGDCLKHEKNHEKYNDIV